MSKEINVTDLKNLMHDMDIQDICGSYNTFSYKVNINMTKQSKQNKEKQSIKQEVTPLINIPQESKVEAKNLVLQKLQGDANKCNSIDEIKEYLQNSDFCELKKIATNTVVSDGVSDAEYMVIGEAPGEDEDINGIPFCGRSGRLLDNILNSVNISRKTNTYITNTLFWRPPGNRKPTYEEIVYCRPFVMRQIEIIKPKILILTGSSAIEAMLSEKSIKITDARQKIFDIKVNDSFFTKAVAIYHPSYLLRNPTAKKLAWKDMMFLKKILDCNI